MIHPIKFVTDCDVLPIKGDELELLKKKPQQILWVRNRVYGIVPIERVKIILALAEGSQADVVRFSWHEIVEIPEVTGRAMTDANGEKEA